MPESSVVATTRAPISGLRLIEDLRSLGVEPGAVVLVHASLSSLGWVIGGAQAVVESLLEAVGDRGTIVVPAQSSQLSDPSNWAAPPVPPGWHAEIRKHMPAYDPAMTPTRGLGAIAECLSRCGDSIRSAHPLASFAARGPAAREIVGEHPLTPALGETSPLGKLYVLDANVLLLGVGHDRNTSLHLAEHRAHWPSKRNRREGAPIRQNGDREWVSYEDLDLDADDFDRIGEAFAATGGEKVGYVAQARSRLMRHRALVDFAADWISENRD